MERKKESTSGLQTVTNPIKPVYHTYIFEFKKQWKKFIIFLMISVLIPLLLGLLPNALLPGNPLPATQAEYFSTNQSFLTFLLIFANCFFFSGIICREYDKQTGFILFPKINKYKLILGKFLGNYTIVMGITAAYYYTLATLGVYYYGFPITIKYLYSFGIALLYILAVSSFVTFFSAIMPKVTLVIVTTILILLIGFNMYAQISALFIPDIEPIFSIQYAGNLISSILDFPEVRYTDFSIMGFTFRTWLTPTIRAGITVMLIYTGVFLFLSAIIFKRKQL